MPARGSKKRVLHFCFFLGLLLSDLSRRTGQGFAAAADAADHSRKAQTSPRQTTQGVVASSVSLLAAMITEEAAAAYLARRKRSHVPPRRGKERPLSVWPRRPRLHPNLPLLASSWRNVTPLPSSKRSGRRLLRNRRSRKLHGGSHRSNRRGHSCAAPYPLIAAACRRPLVSWS